LEKFLRLESKRRLEIATFSNMQLIKVFSPFSGWGCSPTPFNSIYPFYSSYATPHYQSNKTRLRYLPVLWHFAPLLVFLENLPTFWRFYYTLLFGKTPAYQRYNEVI
jgi:hypothetical protein